MARGLNYISGLEYTPASLGFLLRERQWRMGEIEKLRKRIAAESGRIARLQRVLADRDGARSGGPLRAIRDSGVKVAAAEARIAELQGDIGALDRVIAMHPHKVDLAKLPPVRKRLPDLLPRGHLERSVINALRLADGRPLATAEIAVAVALEHGVDTRPGEATWGRVRKACVKCLNYLLKLGHVERLHPKKTYGDGFWIVSGRGNEEDLASPVVALPVATPPA